MIEEVEMEKQEQEQQHQRHRLDALMANHKMSCQTKLEETSSLLDMLQMLTQRRDELRLIDKQLYELMDECFLRLDSDGRQARNTAGSNCFKRKLDETPIDLTRQNKHSSDQKQTIVPVASEKAPQMNIKKMRLLSAIRQGTIYDDEREKKDSLEQTEMITYQTKQDYKATSTHVIEHEEEDAEQEQQLQNVKRPELKKFCSIGTAEICREQFARQQQMFDLTLSKLIKDTTITNKMHNQIHCNHYNLPQHHEQQHMLNYQLHLRNPNQQQIVQQPFEYHQFEYLNHIAIPNQDQISQNQLHQQDRSIAYHMNTGYCNQQLHTPAHPFDNQIVSSSSSSTISSCSSSASACVQTLKASSSIATTANTINSSSRSLNQLLRNVATAGPTCSKDLAPLVRKMAFKCHVCQSCFEDRHRLQQHLSIHLNLHPSWFEEKTIKETMAQYELRRGDYLCQVCQIRYETTSEYDKHMHLHGDKPHQCNLCSREQKFVSFRYFRQLLTHLRSHCFLYSCKFAPECRQTANRKDYLKLHILKHHLNNKLPEQFTICCH